MVIKGDTLRDAMISGANNITNHKRSVDELNVFPVPDGDTGTNMSMTIGAAAKELRHLDDSVTVAQTAETAASALLRGARGNSGVILSLLFRGFAKGLQGKKTAGAADIATALTMGVDAAYKAVMKPTEGTILTVARLSALRAAELSGSQESIAVVWGEICKAAAEALAQTPELLPVLKKAGVVDAGGKGLVVIFEGMLQVLQGGEIIPLMDAPRQSAPKQEEVTSFNAAGEFEGEIAFTYCTEFIVNKSPDCKDALSLRAFLETIGDSVVVVDDDEIIKVHVHTEHPGKALEEGLLFGSLINLKIENMRQQHEDRVREVKLQKVQEFVPVAPENPYGFVAVGAGAGIEGLFKDLGADQIVRGGQTMNPSTEDILRAVHATPAHTVFVLPNNKNIIMAAEQAVKLADRRVCVLQSRSIPQGISAMLAFDPEADFNQNRIAMTRALDKVSTGQITFAARDSDYEGHSIKKGEILALENGKLSFTEKDVTKAALRLTKKLCKGDTAFVTLLYGADVTDDNAKATQQLIQSKLPSNVEVTLISGGQPVYYYIISVE